MNKVGILVVLCSVWSVEGLYVNKRGLAIEHSRRDVCDIICDDTFGDQRVCGHNGVEYKTRCEFDKAACLARESGGNLGLENTGPCINFNSTCTDVALVQCRSFGIRNESRLICGSDKRTYSSVCSFMYNKCQRLAQGRDLHIVRNGSCETVNGTVTIDCTPHVVDVSGLALESGPDTIIMQSCPRKSHNPICTINGFTYNSECSYCSYLAHYRKLRRPDLTVQIAHQGECSRG